MAKLFVIFQAYNDRKRFKTCDSGDCLFKEYITEEDGSKNNNLFFREYNDNHKLNVLLNVEDIYSCTKKINGVYSRLLFKQTLLEDWSKEVDIDDIEAYINQNTRG